LGRSLSHTPPLRPVSTPSALAVNTLNTLSTLSASSHLPLPVLDHRCESAPISGHPGHAARCKGEIPDPNPKRSFSCANRSLRSSSPPRFGPSTRIDANPRPSRPRHLPRRSRETVPAGPDPSSDPHASIRTTGSRPDIDPIRSRRISNVRARYRCQIKATVSASPGKFEVSIFGP
jgi:hypothetical protein